MAELDIVHPLVADLPRLFFLYATTTSCYAAGWGQLLEGGETSDHLQEVRVPIWNTCKESYNSVEFQICGGNKTHGGKDTCQGRHFFAFHLRLP